jgi:hypothetical protein
VPADLTEDRRNGECGERPAQWIESVHSVEQADRADLHQVVVRLAATAEALREVMYQGKLRLHDLFAKLLPAVAARWQVGELV